MIRFFPKQTCQISGPLAVIAWLLGSGYVQARQGQEEEEERREEGRKGQFQAQRGEAPCEGEGSSYPWESWIEIWWV